MIYVPDELAENIHWYTDILWHKDMKAKKIDSLFWTQNFIVTFTLSNYTSYCRILFLVLWFFFTGAISKYLKSVLKVKKKTEFYLLVVRHNLTNSKII